MPKSEVRTNAAPAPVGPYSQAIRAGHFLFVAGQVPIDPATGEMPAGIGAQTCLSLGNIRGILKAAGGSMADVVKTTVFLQDLNDFAAMNKVYATFFADPPPARACVQAARLPKDARVEIDAIAVFGL